jgi:hypothetical protein
LLVDALRSSANVTSETAPAAPRAPRPGIPKKTLIYGGLALAALWAFALHTDSLVVEIIAAVVTAAAGVLLALAWRMVRKQRGLVDLLEGATESPDARRDAIAKLEAGKDADAPVQLFARAQLLAQDDPKAALALLEKQELKSFPAAIQDDVATLETQLYLGLGATQDARKVADTINLDNPQRKQMRTLAGVFVAEAFARTGKPKEALALLDTLEPPPKDAEQIALQTRVVRVFAKFALNQRAAARAELAALAADDVNLLGRFLAPHFRVHPELQKLARQVAEAHPAARSAAKTQARRR